MLVLGAVGLALYLFRAPLLSGAARLLVDEDPPAAPGFVVILSLGEELSEAARLCREEQAEGVLFLTGPPRLAQRLGVLTPDSETARRTLTQMGVADRVQLLAHPGHRPWDGVRRLGEWLDEHPTARVTFLCGRFQGRKWRYLFHVLLAPGAAARVRLRSLAKPDYDESNWWHCKEGKLDFFAEAIAYAHVRLVGEGEGKPPWDPDQYEKSLHPSARATPQRPAARAGSAGPSLAAWCWRCGWRALPS